MKLKGIKIFISIIMLASVLMPFKIFAETVSGTGPIIGVNVSITDHDHETYNNSGTITLSTNMTRWQCDQVLNGACALYISKSASGGTNDDITGTVNFPVYTSDNYVYTYDFVFDADYVGSVTFTNSFGATTSRTYYVNGSHLIISSVSSVSTFTISSYSLAKKSEDTIMWMFPIESFNLIYSMISNNIEMADFYQYANYTFPFFNLKTNNLIGNFYWYQNVPNRFIYFCKNYTITETTFPQYFSVPSGVSFHDSGTINYVRIGSTTYYLAWVETIQTSSASIRGNLTYVNSETLHFMPVFFGRMDRQFISTDFALNFGLSNQLLDDIHIIAQGTLGSQQAETDLDSGTDSMQQSIDSIVSIENSYTSDFNSSLENIDFSDPIQSNQGILPAANFVISVFNGLILNNPLSLLIIIVCVLTIGKRVIGK